ncbi:amino acid ABC transporter ATP-binding protein [Sodalis ligni]|nr:amino acid ABC transporter ATP-binding protein [Sodalis ligni]QWA13443.1 amino acid ABC transporter ATP-binding protein [Sodalis ligni]
MADWKKSTYQVESLQSSLTTPLISLAQVVKDYGDTRVLDHLNLAIPEGQKVALIGPSGSGKSTVLRLIKGLETVSNGTVTMDGAAVGSGRRQHRWFSRGPVRHQVGMVFQHFNLFPHLTVEQNIMEAPLRVLKLDVAQARERAHYYLQIVGLAHKAPAWPATLSGGQQQRVAIARALAMQPRVMLFDEVTSALDPESVGEVLKVIRDVAHGQNMTMLLVTHEMSFARDVADRVLFMEKGKIIDDGTPEQVLVNPLNPRTRQFLNILTER